MPLNQLSIFISHPSELLTNHQPYGDGLIAFEFIQRLAQKGHSLHVAAPAVDIQGVLPENIRIYPVSLRAPFSALKPLEYMAKVRQILNQVRRHHNVDLIHQLNPVNPGLSVGLLDLGLPLVLGPFWLSWPSPPDSAKPKPSISGAIASLFTRPLVRRCSSQQQRAAAALLLSTPAAGSELDQRASSPSKIHTLSPGIDTALFSPNLSGNAQEKSETSILFLANLEYRKGIFTLLEAFERVAEAMPACQLLIGGDGSQREAVQQRVSQMACQPQITLLGRVERQRVPELMHQCTVYCLPSYGEPFGMSALEAMACGKPVVATQAGGLAYLVPDQGGRKVPLQDAPALADALIEVLASAQLQLDMGQYNRRWVEAGYSWDHIVEKLESIYLEIKK